MAFVLRTHALNVPSATIKRLNSATGAGDVTKGMLAMYDSTNNGVTPAVAGPGLTLDKIAGIYEAGIDVSVDPAAMVTPLTHGALVETVYNAGTPAVGDQVEFNITSTVHGVVVATGGAILGVVEEVLDATNKIVLVRVTGGMQHPGNGIVVQRVDITADASGATDFTALFSGELIQAWTHATATNASGTLQVRRGTTGITDAMACATANAVDKADTITQASKDITAGETLNVIANGAADRGEVYLMIMLG